MALLFSAVTVTAGEDEIELLVGGIPREYDDLEGWSEFDDLMYFISEETEVSVRAEAYLYGEGESPGISRCISVGSDIVDKLNFAALASPNARYVIAKERKTLESLIELWGKVTGLSLSFFQSIL